ncbi:diacylglycerol kinase [Sodalis ligni]|jgi:diacylglycerol kinase (ATP)|uniref:Diacylglycerol kinase n=1 Tax=Sodalis ligni TaxID=2697027 RepID=A0A4R1NFK9_9GAMM|nr:diacylglycerol kinase [Sodalis ligni]QWA10931.1 diacylglycerol kinase [Sodalis ligni]TCL05709.1 diacylglycerol kinase (ATP) [Sodalis ligni]
MANQISGLKRIYNAMGYSLKGLSAAWRHEAAFRQEAVIAILAIVLAYYLESDAISRILLIGSVWLVLVMETINSAIEAVVDRIGPELHPLSGRAKDLGSAAVALAIILAAWVWITLLWRLFR